MAQLRTKKAMAKLILSMDGLVLKEIPLRKERMSIGRKAHNDIQIDNMAISGEHAAVVTILNDSFLEDLNSTNGTLVNGQPVKKHFLKDGDVIELGKYKMKYLVEAVASWRRRQTTTKACRFAQGRCPMWPRSAMRWLLQRGRAVATAPAPHPAAAIQLLSGSNAGHHCN
jgi:predicted component of type VI protein secretion system